MRKLLSPTRAHSDLSWLYPDSDDKPLQPPSGSLSFTRSVGPHIPLAAEWHQSPRIYCITSFFFQASGSRWMFFVFGIVCARGCLVFYWHELLETQGWLNMTFFLYWWLLLLSVTLSQSVFVTFSMSLFTDVLTLLSPQRELRPITYAHVNRTETSLKSMLLITVVVHCERTALWVHLLPSAIVFLALYVCRREMTCYVTWTLKRKKKKNRQQWLEIQRCWTYLW